MLWRNLAANTIYGFIYWRCIFLIVIRICTLVIPQFTVNDVCFYISAKHSDSFSLTHKYILDTQTYSTHCHSFAASWSVGANLNDCFNYTSERGGVHCNWTDLLTDFYCVHFIYSLIRHLERRGFLSMTSAARVYYIHRSSVTLISRCAEWMSGWKLPREKAWSQALIGANLVSNYLTWLLEQQARGFTVWGMD